MITVIAVVVVVVVVVVIVVVVVVVVAVVVIIIIVIIGCVVVRMDAQLNYSNSRRLQESGAKYYTPEITKVKIHW